MPGRTYWKCEPEELVGLTVEAVERTPAGDVFVLSDGTCVAFVPVRNPSPEGSRVIVQYERSRPNQPGEGG